VREGHRPVRRDALEKIFGRAPPLFGSKSTNSHFGERFCDDGQYSLVSFLFAVLLQTVPLCPAIRKSARVPYGVGATNRNCYSSVI